jgi:uncharacterized protein YciI
MTSSRAVTSGAKKVAIAPSTLYIVLLRYSSVEGVERNLADHRVWVEPAVKDGHFLLAGPTLPVERSGAIIAAASSREFLEQLLNTDPFHLAGIASREIIEFAPGRGTLRSFPENPLFG